MELKEIASIAGKSGLFKVLKPSRSGVIVETLDAEKKKLSVGHSTKVSILKEISIYTTDQEGSIPLENVLRTMKAKFAEAPIGIDTKTASSAELLQFIEEIVPNFDSNKVYASDVKKLINWYAILSLQAPEVFEEPQVETPQEENTPLEEIQSEQIQENPAEDSNKEPKASKPKRKSSSSKKKEDSEVTTEESSK